MGLSAKMLIFHMRKKFKNIYGKINNHSLEESNQEIAASNLARMMGEQIQCPSSLVCWKDSILRFCLSGGKQKLTSFRGDGEKYSMPYSTN